MKRKSSERRGAPASLAPAPVVVVLLAAGAAGVLPQFYVTLLNYVGLYSLVALGLVLLTGVRRQISFGQAAFVGVGAYATAGAAPRRVTALSPLGLHAADRLCALAVTSSSPGCSG